MHEILRKTTLCGLIVYFEPSQQPSVAILVCVFAVAAVHFFRPPRNHLVRRVLQVEVICTTFKYLGAILIVSAQDNGGTKNFIGLLLLTLDVFVMVFSLISATLIMWNISSKVQRMSLVAPGAKAQADAPSRFRRRLTVSQIQTAVTEHKLAVFEKRHDEEHAASLEVIRQRRVRASARVKERVAARTRQKKSRHGDGGRDGGSGGGGDGPASVEQ